MEDYFLSLSAIKKMLADNNLRPNKSLGQHFLIDKNILQKILQAAELTATDRVLEVGAGLGTLSLPLAARSAGLIAVEIDRGLFPLLQKQLQPYPHARAVRGDVRRFHLKKLCFDCWGESPVKVVANLPYYLTTPFLFQLLQEGPPLSLAVLMIQKEAALRLVAAPGTKEYGLSSILCSFYTKPAYLFPVPPTVFYPRPAVSSAVISLKPREKPFLSGPRADLFWQVVKTSFASRRKTLLNNLCQKFKLSREILALEMLSLGIDELRRGESLSLEEFAKITDLIYNIKS